MLLELSERRIDWSVVSLLYRCRLLLAVSRGEKWIRKILRKHAGVCFSDVRSRVPSVYLLFNVKTKKVYVGQTKNSVLHRFAQHFYVHRKSSSLRVYNYVRSVGFEKWLFIPIERPTQGTLLQRERFWMQQYRSQLINDPVTWTHNRHHRNRRAPTVTQEQRAISRRSFFSDVRSSLLEFYRDDSWKLVPTPRLFQFLESVEKAKFKKQFAEVLQAKIRRALVSHGVKVLSSYVFKVPTCVNLNRRALRQWVIKTLRSSTSDRFWVRYVCRHLRIVGISHQTYRQLLANYRRAIQSLDLSQSADQLTNVTCECEHWPTLINADCGHINMKASDLPGEFGFLRSLFQLNSNGPVQVSPSELWACQEQYLLDQLCDLVGACTIDRTGLRSILSRHVASREARFTKSVVSHQLCSFPKITFVPLDKNSKSWALVCSRWYCQKVIEHFGGPENKFYRIVPESESDIRAKIAEDYRLAGLDTAKRFRRDWSIGHAYLLPKNKDIKKFRPLVSFFKFGSKPLGRLVSRALSVMTKAVTKKWNTLDAFSTSDAVKRIHKVAHKSEWRKACKDKNVSFVKFDIKNQFTCLDKTAVVDALSKFVSFFVLNFGTFISVSRRRDQRATDAVGKRSLSTHFVLTANDVRSYCLFEMRNTVFRVGCSFVQQLHGLGMGGFVSANLAVIWAMAREHDARSTWNPYKAACIGIRFRDDIELILRHSTNTTDIENMRRQLEEAYGGGIELELEEVSHDRSTFLDMIISAHDGGLQVGHLNRNVNFELGTIPRTLPFAISRFPDFAVGFPKSIYVGTMIGAFKRASFVCNSYHTKFFAVFQLVFEFIFKHYPIRWIRSALMLSSVDCAEVLKCLL